MPPEILPPFSSDSFPDDDQIFDNFAQFGDHSSYTTQQEQDIFMTGLGSFEPENAGGISGTSSDASITQHLQKSTSQQYSHQEPNQHPQDVPQFISSDQQYHRRQPSRNIQPESYERGDLKPDVHASRCVEASTWLRQ